MKSKKTTRRALLTSMLSLLICVSMLVGSTFAWFTDSVTSKNNIIKSGNLDVTLDYYDAATKGFKEVTGQTKIFNDDARWEPGYTEVAYLKIGNAGTLALKYQLAVNVVEEITGKTKSGEEIRLSEHLVFKVISIEENAVGTYTRETAKAAAGTVMGLKSYNSDDKTLKNTGDAHYVALIIYMPESVGNEANHNGKDIPSIELGVNLVATQMEAEKDSFDEKYDHDATYPIVKSAVKAAGEAIEIVANEVSATVPADAGEGTYTLKVENKAVETDLVNYTEAVSYDITLLKDGAKVSGIEVAVEIYVGKDLDIISVTHNGQPVSPYNYDPNTGVISFTTSSFSPFEITYGIVPDSAAACVSANGSKSYYEKLSDAFAAAEDGAVITLLGDVVLTETLVFDKDVTATFDLGGFTVSGPVGTLLKIADGKLTVKNGSLKNVHEAATDTKYSVYMSGDAVAEIQGVSIETSGTGIYMAENAKITELNANVLSYMNANGYCCYDAVSLVDNARIDKISGGSYESCYTAEYIQSWYENRTYSGIESWTVNLNGEGASIGEISGGTFLGVMDKANNGTAIHVNNGTVELISGGYFGFSKTGLSNPIRLFFVNAGTNASISRITGGTFEKGTLSTGYGCDFAGVVDASGCQIVETGETVNVNIQFSTKVTTYTLKVIEVVTK